MMWWIVGGLFALLLTGRICYVVGRYKEAYKHYVWHANTVTHVREGFEVFNGTLQSEQASMDELLREFELTLYDFVDALDRPYTDETLGEPNFKRDGAKND